MHGEEVPLEDGMTERRKLDLTGAAELLRIFNSYLRHEQAARAGSQGSDESRGQDVQAAEVRAQRKAEAVKQRALQEGWSMRRWQDFAAAAGREAASRAAPAVAADPTRSSAWLFRSDEDRLVVHVRRIEGSTAADLQRLVQCLSELLEQVRRKAQNANDVEDRAAEKVGGRVAAPASSPSAESIR